MVALITSVWETLKMNTSGAAKKVAVPFCTHKPVHSAKVFPYPAYFVKFNHKDCKRPKHPFIVPKSFSVRYPFEEALLKKWFSPPVMDPPISRMNKATMILVEESPSF